MGVGEPARDEGTERPVLSESGVVSLMLSTKVSEVA